MTSRRDFLERSAAAALSISLSIDAPSRARSDGETKPAAPSPTFLDLRRQPDVVSAQTDTDDLRLRIAANGRWAGGDVVVQLVERPDALNVQLVAPSTAIKRVHLRWRGRID